MSARRLAEIDQRDIIMGRKRVQYGDTPPPSSPEVRRPSLVHESRPSRHGPPRGHHGRQDFRRDKELRRILDGLRVDEPTMTGLERRWLELKEEARNAKKASEAREREIDNHKRHIHNMKAAKENLESKLVAAQDEQARTSALLQAEQLGRTGDQKIHALANDKRSEELASMRALVDEKDKSMRDMYKSLMATISASSDEERLRLALDTQAQQILGFVQRLQADVAAKEAQIEELQADVTEKEGRVKQIEDLLDEGVDLFKDAMQQEELAKEVEKRAAAAEERAAEAKLLVAAAEKRAEAAEKRAEAADRRAAEAIKTAEQQQRIINGFVQQNAAMPF
ncbi:hypothetical protein M409DRAFT_20883 [Zasmidium cellare ATCC 36951]|uniref:Uncharacterized protein n=1 Tax=Zasmidium cellare ATCC 36951 TaxID=1080233 RepID=A0A6A6CRV0_ZASCE|nr:uncharacterized protein M409DRAFT_20883 [Zasmidium cellare ATCC 36951]KAF2168870.1 hypothetical protein M409DRAFT_20883 [Zasmidium cellare ATCC 36951]